jgi:hypothetical protein
MILLVPSDYMGSHRHNIYTSQYSREIHGWDRHALIELQLAGIIIIECVKINFGFFYYRRERI